VDQLLKWYKGNKVWALAVVRPDEQEPISVAPAEIQTNLHTYQDVFATPSGMPP
jgi:hypothetical protein